MGNGRVEGSSKVDWRKADPSGLAALVMTKKLMALVMTKKLMALVMAKN